jgi:cell division septum initiation protein DivIVA
MSTRVVIDENEYLRLIDQMRISVPQEIKNARQVEAERDALLAAAQEQADAMLEAANERSDALTADHVVLAQAQQRADEILTKAYEEAAQIRSEADAYSLEVLHRIKGQLEHFGLTVANGIRLLEAGDSVGEPEADIPDLDRSAASGGESRSV